MEKTFNWKDRMLSFGYAWQGLKALLRTEHNSRIHLIATAAVLPLGLWLHISAPEAVVLVLLAALVWMAELFNTAIEKTADLICRDRHPQIKLIKDLSAAAVLVAAVAALLAGSIILLPKLLELWKSL